MSHHSNSLEAMKAMPTDELIELCRQSVRQAEAARLAYQDKDLELQAMREMCDTVQSLRQVIQESEQKIEEKDHEIEEKRRKIEEKDHEIQAQNQEIHAKARKIQTNHQEIEEKRREIQAQNQEIHARFRKIQTNHQEIIETKIMIEVLQATQRLISQPIIKSQMGMNYDQPGCNFDLLYCYTTE